MVKKIRTDKNLIFVFKYAQLDVDVNQETYGELEELIKKQVKMLSREIHIDRTYVDYKGTKYNKTFLYEKGWNELCKLLENTRYGKNATKEQYLVIHSAYSRMIIAYVYQLLEDLGYDISNIELSLKNNTSFTVEILHDTIQNDNYRGKWQNWY